MDNYYICSISGGKDSLYMFYYLLSQPEKYKIDAVVHFSTEIDWPFTKNVVSLVRNECEKHSIKFFELTPDVSWESLYYKYGFPSKHVRWCNGQYKLSMRRTFLNYIRSLGFNPITYIGICSDETKRIKKDSNIIYPLVDANITESSILSWARNQKCFDDYYLYNSRQGCMLCPFLSLNEIRYLKQKYPDYFKKYVSYIRSSEIKYKYLFRGVGISRIINLVSNTHYYKKEDFKMKIENELQHINKDGRDFYLLKTFICFASGKRFNCSTAFITKHQYEALGGK